VSKPDELMRGAHSQVSQLGEVAELSGYRGGELVPINMSARAKGRCEGSLTATITSTISIKVNPTMSIWWASDL